MGMSDPSINDFNLKIRTSPWYQEWFAQKGLDPNKVKLNDRQREELKQLVEANTDFKFPKDMKIDPAGNLNEKGGWAGLPTGVKIALIAAAAVGTAGAAGAFAGAGGAGGIGIGGGATAGTGAGVSASVPAASTLATIGGAAGTGLSTMDKIGAILGPASKAVGAAGAAAGQNAANQQVLDAQHRLQANAQNISGESAFQNQQQSMAQLEAQQQEAARKNLYRASVMKNPTVSSENRRGAPTFSPEMLEGLTNLEKAALDRTRTTQYSTAQMRAPRDYQPLDLDAMREQPKSTMGTIGNWLAPGLSIADLAFRTF